MVDDESPAWLIECKAPVKSKDLDFRNYIWFEKRDQNDIITKTRINPKAKFILEFTLTKHKTLNTYLLATADPKVYQKRRFEAYQSMTHHSLGYTFA
ncbi:MAG: hypothetical protein ACD_62C00090G0002 [uncultured bacterium]|nr:MAG: hypothetical protein ACD_62C00090G0002 [uncultured bacterium]